MRVQHKLPQRPTVSIYANPSSIPSGQSSYVSFSSQNATSCTNNMLVQCGYGGNYVYPSGTMAYTATCTGAGGSASNSATIYVYPANPDGTHSSDLIYQNTPSNLEELIQHSKQY